MWRMKSKASRLFLGCMNIGATLRESHMVYALPCAFDIKYTSDSGLSRELEVNYRYE